MQDTSYAVRSTPCHMCEHVSADELSTGYRSRMYIHVASTCPSRRRHGSCSRTEYLRDHTPGVAQCVFTVSQRLHIIGISGAAADNFPNMHENMLRLRNTTIGEPLRPLPRKKSWSLPREGTTTIARGISRIVALSCLVVINHGRRMISSVQFGTAPPPG